MNIVEIFKNKLIKNEQIEVEYFQHDFPLSGIAKSTVLEEGYFCDENGDIGPFNFSNGLSFNWAQKRGGNKIKGECHIPRSLDIFFDDGYDKYWDGETPGDEYGLFCKRLTCLDAYQRAHDGMISIAIERNIDERCNLKRLWYWNDEGNKYPLTLTLKDYLDQMIKFKGILYWQLLFIDLKNMSLVNDHKIPFSNYIVKNDLFLLKSTLSGLEKIFGEDTTSLELVCQGYRNKLFI